MSSIRRRLLVWLLLGLSVTTLVAAYAVYARTRVEAEEIFDYQLQVMAASFPNEGLGPAIVPPADEADAGDVVVVQIWDQNGAQVYLSRPGSPVLHRVELGYSTVRTGRGNWRVFNTIVGGKFVQVSQSMGAREELAAGLALRTMLPLLILLPVLIGLIWITVGRGLQPLDEIAAALKRRTEDVLEPLPADRVPAEVKPLVVALNDLLGRLGGALDVQRTFIADAAHELRTPLTAVRLQLQLAEGAANDAERAAAFTQLRCGTERAARLVQQLLTLARNEPGAAARPRATVDISGIARQVVAEQAPIAEAHGLDLGLSAAGAVLTLGDADALQTMLGNLVDNAIKYTPRGGVIDVAVTASDGHATWVVTDSGPGIPDAERARVFDRFYRHETAGTTGSGLGLAIVQRVAQRHGATVELAAAPDGHGLKVTVHFPS